MNAIYSNRFGPAGIHIHLCMSHSTRKYKQVGSSHWGSFPIPEIYVGALSSEWASNGVGAAWRSISWDLGRSLCGHVSDGVVCRHYDGARR